MWLIALLLLKRVSFYILGIVTLNFFMRCNCICTLKLKLFFCSRSHSRKIQIFKNLYLFGALTYLKSQGILLWSSCLNHERGSQKANMLEGNLLKRGGWKICRFKEGLAKRKRGGGDFEGGCVDITMHTMKLLNIWDKYKACSIWDLF